jgi:hypothetical protein
MDRNAYRDDNDTGQPDAYWRRRVITLCAGLALLGVLAWAFSGGGKPASPAQKGTQANGVLPAAAYSGPAISPSPGADASASASAGPVASLPFPTESPSARTSRPGRGPSSSGKSAAGGGGNATPGPAGGVEPGGACAPGAVVLSLFTSRTSYPAGQDPAFEVYAVSTASRACSFDVSPTKLHVLVMSSGRVIWDSADCTRGEPNRVAELRRGVPANGFVSWNRTISLPGCVTLASSARLGTYQVQARDATVASPIRTFKLAR